MSRCESAASDLNASRGLLVHTFHVFRRRRGSHEARAGRGTRETRHGDGARRWRRQQTLGRRTWFQMPSQLDAEPRAAPATQEGEAGAATRMWDDGPRRAPPHALRFSPPRLRVDVLARHPFAHRTPRTIRRAFWNHECDFFWGVSERREHGDSGNRTEEVHQEGEVHGRGRCPQSHSERGEWTESLLKTKEPSPERPGWLACPYSYSLSVTSHFYF